MLSSGINQRSPKGRDRLRFSMGSMGYAWFSAAYFLATDKVSARNYA